MKAKNIISKIKKEYNRRRRILSVLKESIEGGENVVYNEDGVSIYLIQGSHFDHGVNRSTFAEAINAIREFNKTGRTKLGHVEKIKNFDSQIWGTDKKVPASPPSEENGYIGSGFLIYSVTLNHEVGQSALVPRRPTDKVEVLIRGNRKHGSLIATNRNPEKTNILTIILANQNLENLKSFVLVTTFAGQSAEVEAWDDKAKDGDKIKQNVIDFWKKYILVKVPDMEYRPAPQEDVDFFKKIGLL